MDTIRCSCGAQYRFKPELAGKRVRCKHCQAAITFPRQEVPSDEDAFDWSALTEGQVIASSTPEQGVEVAARPVAADHASRREPAPDLPRGSYAAYLKDCAWSFAFIAEPGNIITFLIVAAFYAIAPLAGFAPCIGLIAMMVIYAWYCGYLFQVLEGAAGGEHDLPTLTPEGDWWEGVVLPIVRFLAVSALTFGPAAAAIYWRWDIINVTGTIYNDPVIMAALTVGIFLNPIFMLVVALGGISCLARIDLMLRTIGQTLPAYLLTVLAVLVAAGANWLVAVGLNTKMTSTTLTNAFALLAVGRIAALYFMIVTMMVIGMYYHHFKARFAWSWG